MNAIAPETINPLNLPFLPLKGYRDLPECPAIYFAIDDNGIVQYIGQSTNIRQRWLQHHKGIDVASIGDVKLAWLEISDKSLLRQIETALIAWFQPPLNEVGKVQNIKPVKGKVQNRIKQFLQNRSITPYQFRKDTGIAQRTAYDLYNNPEQLPSSTVLTKICDTYEVQPGELLEWVPKSEKPNSSKTDSIDLSQANSSHDEQSSIEEKTKSKSRMRSLPPKEVA